ncbi:hypothetical protein GmHk_11G031858 [Glycine max]|nr:hypothetical protein GmHk_11G031858 [Glycine max]
MAADDAICGEQCCISSQGAMHCIPDDGCCSGVAERESNQLRIPGDEARVRVGVALGSLAAVFISRLFVCSDYLDWFLMVVASLAATAHNTVIEREKM